MLKAAAAAELKRAVAAAAEIQRLDRIARETGWTIVLLKASRLVADGISLFLHDVDLLLPPGLDVALAGRLESLGYEQIAPDVKRSQHLGARRLPSFQPVEIHRVVPGIPETYALLGESLPCEGTESLRRLSDQHQIEHTLHHSVVHHPDRQGRIRDALILAELLERLSHEHRTAVLRGVGARIGRTVDAWLSLADSLRQGTACVDPFREAAPYRYTLLHAAGGSRVTRRVVNRAATIGPPGNGMKAHLKDAIAFATSGVPPRHRILAVLRRIPLAGTAVQPAARLGLHFLACCLGRYVVAVARSFGMNARVGESGTAPTSSPSSSSS